MEIRTLDPLAKYVLQGKVLLNPGSALTGPMQIFIENDRITEIRSLDLADSPNTEGFQIIDYRDQIICPGLIDCHVHLALDGQDFKGSVERWSNSEALKNHFVESLFRYLSSGIVLLRDGGDRALATFNHVRHRSSGTFPRVLSTGQAIRLPNSYGSFLGTDIHDRQDICHLLNQLLAQGAQWVKVLVTGLVSFQEFGKVGTVQISQEDLTFLVREAHTRGLAVMAHANGDQGVTQAIKARVNSIEHGYFMSMDTLNLMADHQIPWVPTIIPVAAQLQEDKRSAWTPDQQKVIDQTINYHLENIAKGQAKGILIGAGSDAGAGGVEHGPGLLRELNLLGQAGLSGQQVLATATHNAATICDQDKDYGRISPGKKPALLILSADPTTNLRTLENPTALVLPAKY